MRRVFTAALFFVLAAFAVPALSVWEQPFDRREVKARVEKPSPMVKVLVAETGKVEVLPLEEYLVGVVAAEMPAKFPPEALKAQAVAARTFTLKRLDQAAGAENPHPQAAVCTDFNHCQAWIDRDTMQKNWGKAYGQYLEKITAAVQETWGQAVYYHGKLIDPVYHSTSNGKTENSEDVWQCKVPYLRSVSSPWDRQSPKFRSSLEVPVEKLYSAVGSTGGVQPVSTGGGNILSALSYTSTGRIKTLSVGGKTIPAAEMRRSLGLPSTDLTWKVKKGTIIFEATGYGHGVGMSQYGARGMALEGSSFREILKHYYTGVEVRAAY